MMQLRWLIITAALLLGSFACSSPTLWIGTAHGDVAGQPALDPPPWRAADGGRPANLTDPPPSAAMDAGTSPVVTGSSQATTAAASGNTSSVTDDDAGLPAHDATSQAPPMPRRLPTVAGQCPNLNGDGLYTFSAGGRSLAVQIYMRSDAKSLPKPGGPLVLYFHSLGTSASEVQSAITSKAIEQVVAQGGIVAAFNDTPCLSCGLPDDVVWYDEDDVVSDQVVACALQKGQIDPRRIHSVGFSAGALHSMHLALARSDYIASVISYSGGMPVSTNEPQDPENKVAALLVFGGEGVDIIVADFNLGSHNWHDTYTPKGYYSLLCDHGGGHVIPSEVPPHALRFLLDHPYRVHPEPYLPTIPSEFPGYCRN